MGGTRQPVFQICLFSRFVWSPQNLGLQIVYSLFIMKNNVSVRTNKLGEKFSCEAQPQRDALRCQKIIIES